MVMDALLVLKSNKSANIQMKGRKGRIFGDFRLGVYVNIKVQTTREKLSTYWLDRLDLKFYA